MDGRDLITTAAQAAVPYVKRVFTTRIGLAALFAVLSAAGYHLSPELREAITALLVAAGG